jgi:hypothetical protein
MHMFPAGPPAQCGATVRPRDPHLAVSSGGPRRIRVHVAAGRVALPNRAPAHAGLLEGGGPEGSAGKHQQARRPVHGPGCGAGLQCPTCRPRYVVHMLFEQPLILYNGKLAPSSRHSMCCVRAHSHVACCVGLSRCLSPVPVAQLSCCGRMCLGVQLPMLLFPRHCSHTTVPTPLSLTSTRDNSRCRGWSWSWWRRHPPWRICLECTRCLQ